MGPNLYGQVHLDPDLTQTLTLHLIVTPILTLILTLNVTLTLTSIPPLVSSGRKKSSGLEGSKKKDEGNGGVSKLGAVRRDLPRSHRLLPTPALQALTGSWCRDPIRAPLRTYGMVLFCAWNSHRLRVCGAVDTQR